MSEADARCLIAPATVSASRSEIIGIGVRNESDSVCGAVCASWAPSPGFELDALAGINHNELTSKRLLTLSGVAFPIAGASGANLAPARPWSGRAPRHRRRRRRRLEDAVRASRRLVELSRGPRRQSSPS